MQRTRKQIIFTIAATLMASAGVNTAKASEIYRYVDAEGEVHYVDRPTGAPSEERLSIASKPTSSSQVQARVNQRQPANTTSADQATQEEEKAAELTRAQKRAQAKMQEQKCQKYRDQLETYVTSRRLYREEDQGERVYLDENEVQEARSKMEEMIVKDCS